MGWGGVGGGWGWGAGHAGAVEALCRGGARVEARNAAGRTALHEASQARLCSNHKMVCVQTILWFVEQVRRTALHEASQAPIPPPTPRAHTHTIASAHDHEKIRTRV